MTGRSVIERRPVQIPDVLADPAYDYAEAQRLGGFRAMLGVPMRRDDVVVGVLDLWRDLPQPFTGAGDVAMKGFERPVRVVEIIGLAADIRT